ncbi:MAG: hypothetical protein OEQ28_09770 [Acidobacteriota bacterium]|nr:hypothetical protein [Acidobacteriota bacterium]
MEPITYLAVRGDRTIDSDFQSILPVYKSGDIDVPLTKGYEAIAVLLLEETSGKRVIVSTYKSLQAIAEVDCQGKEARSKAGGQDHCFHFQAACNWRVIVNLLTGLTNQSQRLHPINATFQRSRDYLTIPVRQRQKRRPVITTGLN